MKYLEAGSETASFYLGSWSRAPGLHQNRPIVNFNIEQVHLHISGKDIETCMDSNTAILVHL